MSELTTWLLERIAEDEAVARAATPGPWTARPPHGWDDWDEHLIYGGEHQVTPGGGEHGDDGATPADALHIARHDPARVLAECAAKRAIVEAHSSPFDATAAILEQSGEEWEHLTDDAAFLSRKQYRHNQATLRALASVYAGADGFQEAWRV